MPNMNAITPRGTLAIFTMVAVAALVIAALTTTITVSAQSADPDWRLEPTGLTVLAGDEAGELDITWNAHSQATKTLSDYRVTWTPDGADFKAPGETNWNAFPTTNRLTVTGLDAGETYQVKVRARYDDSKKSRWSVVVTGQSGAAPNSAATGQPVITGTAQVRETLTAGTSSISDDNGLTNVVFNYQWVRRAGGADTDISGATASSYLLGADDLAHSIKVQVTFTDDDGYSGTLTSNATAVVVRPPNVAATGQPTITGVTDVGGKLTAGTSAISDDNGLTNATFTYQWVRSADGADTNISDATSSTYVVSNADAGSTIKVRVSFTDDDGYTETLTSSATASIPANNQNQPRQETDATLSALVLEDASDNSAVALNETFSPATLSYTADVANGVDEITVKPEANDANATFVFLDEDDAELTDADTFQDDFQVTLAAGANTIKVKVTAEAGGSSTETYTVVVTRAMATPAETALPADWSLVPSGLGEGDQFRLLFLSSTKRDATATDIATYNTFIQGRAAAGHAAIQAYSTGFTAVGCTADTDARDNTGTTGTGVPIYWLDGAKVADDYADFYDGDWDEEANDKNELGSDGPDTSQEPNYPFTGCKHDGTESSSGFVSAALGASIVVRVGRPNSSTSGHGPIGSDIESLPSDERPMYGLSQVLRVAASTVATLDDLALKNAADDSALALNETFASTLKSYTANVAYGVTSITIEPTRSNSNATFAYLSASDTALVDADTNKTGFQVTLAAGANTIKVKVTAEAGGSSTETYTVVVTRAMATPAETALPADWSLVPSGLGEGDQFRLLFLSSTKRDATATDIATYNTFIQGRAAAGHAAIQAYSTGFTAVGCTADTDARDNTGTTGTGVPIYWLDGAKVADDYADFYDGDWDEEANDKNELGSDGPDTSQEPNYPFTGCKHDGTESSSGFVSAALGASIVVRVGRPNSSTSGHGPIGSDIESLPSDERPMYGLSQVLRVAASTVATLDDLALKNAADDSALALNETFASTLKSYTANVAYGVTSITIEPTRSNSNATFAYLSASDTALVDADTNKTGFQVTLAAGANTIKVKVTAEAGGSSTETYTVVVTRAMATPAETALPADWSLVPSGLGEGDQFRLLFLSSTKRDATATDIATYNTFIQGRAAAGHAAIQAYSTGFTAVGCTADTDARDNTGTTGTGVPIYWLDGAKVADDYADFYDGDWDEEANDKNELGSDGPDTSQEPNYPFTGCKHDGTESSSGFVSAALGASIVVRVGRPNSSTSGHGPIGSDIESLPSDERPMYGLSQVLRVAASTVATLDDLALKNAADDSALALNETFASTLKSYTANVAYGVTSITIEPTRSNSNATFAYLSASDTALVDADTNKTGFQVTLAAGANTIKVKVTAEAGGSSTETYTVVVTRAMATPAETALPADWSLVPSGLGEGDQFRLLFLSSTKRDATATDIATYNTFIQGRAAAGHAAIQAYSTGFTAVGCTADTDARDNTGTTGTGVPIYWLDGAKVADDYADFYDGDWDEEANDKNELGSDGPDTSQEPNYPFTGCKHDGTESSSGFVSAALGASIVVRVGRPNSSTSGHGPIGSDIESLPSDERPMYGLSQVLRVAASTVATLDDLALKNAADDSALALNETFASTLKSYTANVAYGVTSITIEPTRSNSNATFAYLSASDTALVDADTNKTGFQVTLAAGANTIKVKVTAEAGGSSTETYTVVVTRAMLTPAETEVPNDWSLKPTGLATGAKFRLLFLSSTKRDATATDIATYNTFIQGRAAIQAYSTGFTAVGCTADTDARDNTGTTGTGVPIYWLDGAKVADDYADFYDGDWDEEANDKNESGTNGPNTSQEPNYPFTGCKHDGTESSSGFVSAALGASIVVRVGRPNSSTSGHGPIGSDIESLPSDERPMYGLSQVLRVAASTVATLDDLALKNAADDSALALNETFASTLKSYTANVAYGVTSITIEPTRSNSNATFAYLSASDTALVDADTNKTGFQVTLAAGANTIKVKVTAEAGVPYTDTYTVVVTREASAPTVTISAGQTSATFKEDDITYTLTHSGLTTVAVPVTVLLEQTKDFLAAAELTKTVTIPAGQSEETLTVAASSFQRFAAGAKVEGGTLTATVQDGAGYDLGTPSSVGVAIVIGVTVRIEQASYTVSEADGGLTVKAIGRTRTGEPRPASNASGMNFGLTDGTAINPTDYSSIDSASFNFTPANYSLQSDGAWQAVKTYSITVPDDDLDEEDETFIVTLRYQFAGFDATPLVDVNGNSCGDECQVTVTITDNDTAGVTVSETALTVTEEDATGDTYTVVLDSEPTANVTITVAGHASTDVTLTPSSATLTFTTLNWETAQTVTVKAGNDTDTTNDTVTLTHSAASTDTDYSGITIADVTVTVDDNDDTAPASSDATLSGLTVNDGANDLTLIPAFTPEIYGYAASVDNAITTVTLSATVTHTGAEVTGVTLAGTAIADTDFTNGITVPSLVDGDNEIVVTVTAEDDTNTQDYTVTVTREPPLPVLSFASINISVNEEAGPAVLTVNLSPASAETVTVDYATRGDSAIEGEDFTATSGTLTFAPGETSKNINVPIVDDNLFEVFSQRFNVGLENPSGAILPAPYDAVVEIHSDDPAPTASMENVTVSETNGTMVLTLRLSHPSDRETSYRTTSALLSGTATLGDDYEDFLSGGGATITVPAGRLSQTFDITIIDDGVEEDDETIVISWGRFGSSATPAILYFTGTITDPAQCDNVADTVIVKNLTGEITQAGESQFHNIRLDPFKSYLMEAIGVDGRDMLEVEEHSNLTLEDPAIPALWNAKGTSEQNTFGSTGHDNGFGKNVIRGINKTDYRTYKIEVASGDNGTGTYQLKVRVNNICRLNDDEDAHYHWAGGPKGYPNFDLPAGTGGRHVLFIGTHNDDRVERAELHHVLGDNWDSAPDVDWFGADLEQGKRYSVRLRTKTGLPERLQATQLKILGIYDSDGNAVSTSPSSGVGKKVFVTNWQAPSTGRYYIAVGSDGTDRTGTYWISITKKIAN